MISIEFELSAAMRTSFQQTGGIRPPSGSNALPVALRSDAIRPGFVSFRMFQYADLRRAVSKDQHDFRSELATGRHKLTPNGQFGCQEPINALAAVHLRRFLFPPADLWSLRDH